MPPRVTNSGPLSEVKTTRVFFSIPRASMARKTVPIAWSIDVTCGLCTVGVREGAARERRERGVGEAWVGEGGRERRGRDRRGEGWASTGW